MSTLSVRCIKAAFLYLAIGVGLGALFAFDRALGAQLRPLHAELNLWGWVTLLIYGFGYHMLPRFAGRPISRPRLADAQSWLAIAGVALASLGWFAVPLDLPYAGVLLAAGGVLQTLAVLGFGLLIGTVLRGAPGRPARARS